METQKIVNLLNDIDNESSRFAAKNGKSLLIKITENMMKEIKMIQELNLKKSKLCDYLDEYILVT